MYSTCRQIYTLLKLWRRKELFDFSRVPAGKRQQTLTENGDWDFGVFYDQKLCDAVVSLSKLHTAQGSVREGRIREVKGGVAREAVCAPSTTGTGLLL